MIIQDAEVKLLPNTYTIEDMYRDIERAARICYASEAETNDTLKFINERLIAHHHHRPLEFGTCYLTITPDQIQEHLLESTVEKLSHNKYTYHVEDENGAHYFTTNYRVLVENKLTNLLKFYTEPTTNHKIRYTILWTISRGIADEFRTHTTISSLMQSTRYCCYAKDKFGNQLRIIRPQWFKHTSQEVNDAYAGQLEMTENIMIDGWRQDESRYNSLIQLGVPAQFARGKLPLDIKTEFIQCADLDTWNDFFQQRAHDSTGPAHPDAKYIATIAEQLLINREED